MDPRDDDIEFDFFDDEPATGETQPPPRARLTARPAPQASRPGRPAAGRGAAAAAARTRDLRDLPSCSSSRCSSSPARARRSTTPTRATWSKVDRIATSSTTDGKQVATTLATPGLKVADIVTKLRGIADQERQNVQAAENLNPPGRLRDDNGHLVEALELRVSGVNGLADTFQTRPRPRPTTRATRTCSQTRPTGCSRATSSGTTSSRLPPSPSSSTTASTASSPRSRSSSATDLVTPHSMALVLQRLRGASTGGTVTGLHGTNIVSVKALPAGQTLRPARRRTPSRRAPPSRLRSRCRTPATSRRFTSPSP